MKNGINRNKRKEEMKERKKAKNGRKKKIRTAEKERWGKEKRCIQGNGTCTHK